MNKSKSKWGVQFPEIPLIPAKAGIQYPVSLWNTLARIRIRWIPNQRRIRSLFGMSGIFGCFGSVGVAP